MESILYSYGKYSLQLWKVFFTVMESILYSYGKYIFFTVIDKGAIRASGLIPVIPLTTINKDTQLPMCIGRYTMYTVLYKV